MGGCIIPDWGGTGAASAEGFPLPMEVGYRGYCVPSLKKLGFFTENGACMSVHVPGRLLFVLKIAPPRVGIWTPI